MKKVKFLFPIDGDVLTPYDGEIKDGKLNIRAKIEYNKAKHRAHKSLEYELRLITACIISEKPAPRNDWHDRRDLQ